MSAAAQSSGGLRDLHQEGAGSEGRGDCAGPIAGEIKDFNTATATAAAAGSERAWRYRECAESEDQTESSSEKCSHELGSVFHNFCGLNAVFGFVQREPAGSDWIYAGSRQLVIE